MLTPPLLPEVDVPEAILIPPETPFDAIADAVFTVMSPLLDELE
jgi:hypothetical protein